MHAELPSDEEYVPVVQLPLHEATASPSVSPYLPFAHSEHELCCVCVWYCPLPQLVHSLEPAVE